MRGSVKWFSNLKGFGFLIPEGGGKDIFVHHSSIDMEGFRTLAPGEPVEYELEEGPDGRTQAGRVRRSLAKPPRSPKERRGGPGEGKPRPSS